MPLYRFRCLDCETEETLVAGIDDLTAPCLGCGGDMVRLGDPFDPYFEAKVMERSPRPAALIPEWMSQKINQT